MNEIVFLEGKRLILRPLELRDANSTYVSWLNNIEISKYNSHATFPSTKTAIEQYIESVSNSRTNVVLAIIEKEQHTHIGNISLQNIDWINRSAEFAILLGNRRFSGMGLAKEAATLICNYGFTRLNLYRIYCGTSVLNNGMRKLAKDLGMKEEGIRRSAIYKNGIYSDVIEFGILSTEFGN